MQHMLRQPVAENAIHRAGHQPFGRTIGDLLNELALESTEGGFVRDELEALRKGRRRRNDYV